MKNYLLISFFLVFLMSCSDMANEDSLPISEETSNLSDLLLDKKPIDFEKIMQSYELDNQERLAKSSSHLKKNCSSTIRVPQDYPSIQQAIDNVCEGGSIIVSTGTYFGSFYINKPRVTIKGIGKPEIAGQFVLNENSDGSSIQNLIIRVIIPDNYSYYSNAGFLAYNSDKLTITNNDITDYFLAGNVGINLRNSSKSKIKNNKINNITSGIEITNYEYPVTGYSQDNEISNNTISNYRVSGVLLGGNTIDNIVKNNTIRDQTHYRIIIDYYGGISIFGNNNSIKNNQVSNAAVGYYMEEKYSGNQITGNDFSNNTKWGVKVKRYIDDFGTNYFKNNTIQGNTECDIVDESSQNVYSNNKADCISIL